MPEDNYNNPPEEQNPDLIDENEPIGKMEAVTGIITEPSATFERIAAIKPRIYWVTPVIIFIIASLIAVFLFYSDKELYSSVMDKQRKSMEERFDKSVKDGKMSEEQKKVAMESAEKFMDPKSPFAIGIAVGASVIGPFFIMVLMSLIYLICLKVLKGDTNFTNILNVVGLSFVIGATGKILETVLSIILGTLSNFSLGLVLSEASVGSTVRSLIMKFDVFSIWSVVIVCIGLIKVGKLKTNTIYFVVFAIWILWVVISSFLIPS